jgi:hypothetical protein
MLKVLVGHGVQRFALAIIAFLGVPCLSPYAAAGAGIAFHLSTVFSGSAPVSTNGPWVEAAFRDVSPGLVRLTVTNLNLVRRESLGELYLNLNTNLNPTSLKFSLAGGSGGFDAPKISTGIDLFKADGDGKYDLLFTFTQGGGQNHRFTAGEYLVCDISGIATLTALDFGYLSAPAGGVGPFYAAAHVQRIGSAGLSGWVAPGGIAVVPEPSVGALVGVALALLVRMRRRAC